MSPQERWWRAFVHCDPRRHLAEFFRDGDSRGPFGYLREKGMRPISGETGEYFSVWRPTSMDAMRMLFVGTAVGKALNIKGKSALKGPLTGFVPFLQISREEDKDIVRVSPRDARTRVFFKSWEAKETARKALKQVLAEMVAEADEIDAKLGMAKDSMTDALLGALSGDLRGIDPSWGGLVSDSLTAEQETRNFALRLMQCRCDDPKLYDLDQFASSGIYGLDMPERLLMEAYVRRQDISLPPERETGRASEPAYMDLNLHATRDRNANPGVALWQHDVHNPMSPHTLLMAHEESQVRPVASDMDALLIGSKGMPFQVTLPEDQVVMMSWLIQRIGEVLDESRPYGWNKRWLEVLQTKDLKTDVPMPQYGFGDPQSYDMLSKVVQVVRASGAVRHGAEAFNYHFPQALDDMYLVIWHGFTRYFGKRNAPWSYLTEPQLRDFLHGRIDDGYAFPLNPKWILCDPGWRDVYLHQLRSPHCSEALRVFIPEAHGVRKAIDEISARHPAGFQPLGSADGQIIEDIDYDLAQWNVRRDEVLKRAKSKMRAVARLISVGRRLQAQPSGSKLATEPSAPSFSSLPPPSASV